MKKFFEIALLLILVGSIHLSVATCPTGCECEATTLKVTCSNVTDLQRIADEIDNNTKELVLTESLLTNFDVVFNLTDLEILDLSKNLLTMVPTDVANMFPRLDTLRLDGNRIAGISSADFKGLTNLTKLVLSNNNINTLNDGTFKNLVNLRQLLLKSNQVSTISKDAFQSLSKMYNFDLSENRIQTLVPGLFDHFTNRRISLYLPNNNLKEIPNGLFLKLKEFKTFELSMNQISDIGDEAFQGTKMNVLSLYNNSLEVLSPKSFLNSTINVAMFSNNPLKCTCGLREIFPVIKMHVLGDCRTIDDRTLQFSDLSKFNKSDLISALQCTQCDLNNTCSNGATCNPIGKTDYNCTCTSDFYGQFCENSRACQSSPCRNGGKCMPIRGLDYRCKCIGGFQGKNCDTRHGGLSNSEVAGVTIGVVVTVVLLVIVVYALIVRKRKRESSDPPSEQTALHPNQGKASGKASTSPGKYSHTTDL